MEIFSVIRSQGLLKNKIEMCYVSPSFDMIKILGREKLEKLMILEVLIISEIKLSLKMNLKVVL